MILRNNLITNLGYGWKDVRHWLGFLSSNKNVDAFNSEPDSLTNGRLKPSWLVAVS